MTGILADRTSYRIKRRYQSTKSGKPLKALRSTSPSASTRMAMRSLQDHNGGSPMPFNTFDQLKTFVGEQIDRNYTEHYGTGGSAQRAAG